MNIEDRRQSVAKIGKNFIDGLSKDDSIYILGTNKYGLAVAKFLSERGVNVRGFINDFYQQSTFEDYKVFKSSCDLRSTKLVICVVEGRPMDSEKFVASLEPLMYVNYFNLQLAFPELLGIDFMMDTDSTIKDLEKYQGVYEKLFDERSRFEYECVINFRFNRDVLFLKDFRFRIHEQYFEDFIDFDRVFSFVDGGSFDGQSTLDFIRRCPHYKRIFVFEPNQQSFEKVASSLGVYRDVVLINKGLWNEKGTLSFNSGLGAASRIEELGSNSIDVVDLNSVMEEEVHFIKLDIEGAEKNAIIGASDVIRKYKPILAVCVYHEQTDYYKIYRLILEFNPDYKVFFRHYTQGVFESVMFFIPLNKLKHV